MISASVKSIGKHAFRCCRSLQSVVIPESVTSIGRGAFERCGSLQSVVIPGSVTSIGDDAFADCTSLQYVVIPESVKSIRREAFSRCSSLESVVMPGSVASIERNAFEDCGALKTIKLTGILNPDSFKGIHNALPKSLETLDLSGCFIADMETIKRILDYSLITANLRNIIFPALKLNALESKEGGETKEEAPSSRGLSLM